MFSLSPSLSLSPFLSPSLFLFLTKRATLSNRTSRNRRTFHAIAFRAHRGTFSFSFFFFFSFFFLFFFLTRSCTRKHRYSLEYSSDRRHLLHVNGGGGGGALSIEKTRRISTWNKPYNQSTISHSIILKIEIFFLFFFIIFIFIFIYLLLFIYLFIYFILFYFFSFEHCPDSTYDKYPVKTVVPPNVIKHLKIR